MASIKFLVGSIFALCALGHMTLNASGNQMTDHYLLHEECSEVINDQINKELYASIVYLNMAGYFDRPSVARAGYAKFFRDQSLEEYQHAAKFIEYINKRNGTVKRISIEDSPKSEWNSPSEALNDAIQLEKNVYGKIQHIHAIADQKCQDAHLTDFLESYFFTEQVDSIRDLQEMLSTISVQDPTAALTIEHLENAKMKKSTHGEL